MIYASLIRYHDNKKILLSERKKLQSGQVNEDNKAYP